MNWNQYFLDLAKFVAQKSKDRSTKVGCVIVGPDKEVRSTGFNGFPRGVWDNIDDRHERPAKYLWTEHAERNAIYAAARVGIPLKDCWIYVSWMPCADCARAIIQAGITMVIIDGRTIPDEKSSLRFKDSHEVSADMLREAQVNVINLREGDAWL